MISVRSAMACEASRGEVRAGRRFSVVPVLTGCDRQRSAAVVQVGDEQPFPCGSAIRARGTNPLPDAPAIGRSTH